MSGSTPIPPRKDGAREDHHHHHHLFAPSSLTTSFRSGSPFANEILASDIADCSEDDVDLDQEHDAASLFSEAGSQAGGPVLYKQPQGVAYGVRRPSVLPERGGGGEAVLNPVERVESLNAERSLLRDNHILPPKHGEEPSRGRGRKTTSFSGLYRRLFSTKIRRSDGSDASPDEEQAPAFRIARPAETSPLLSAADAAVSGATNESPEDLNEQWLSAVASGKIKTTWQREAQTIAVYSRSLIVTFLLQYSINIASIFAVGRIGKLELGAVTRESIPLPYFYPLLGCYLPYEDWLTRTTKIQ